VLLATPTVVRYTASNSKIFFSYHMVQKKILRAKNFFIGLWEGGCNKNVFSSRIFSEAFLTPEAVPYGK
jgi:hypothetical protein